MMSENLTDYYLEYVKPQLGRLLRILRLDKNYQHAVGDQMSYLSAGALVSVCDFLGGYGSAILGHNPPFLVQEAENFFKNKRVIQAQASLRSETALLAFLLNQSLQSELNTSEKYICTFASTGTEATEIGLKNAMMTWQLKRDNLKRDLRSVYQSTKSDQAQDEAFRNLNLQLDRVIPVLISLSRSYHGKTASAVLSSSSDYYKKMYSQPLFDSKFLDIDTDFESELEELSSRTIEFKFKNQHFKFSPIMGFIFEPIQGEGGIRPVSSEKLKKVFSLASSLGFPTIADEIQSGLFRTGRFLSSTDLGLTPDMILLGKSLGGGIGKISVMCCREDAYVPELGMIHSSTFAEDDFSSRMAVATLGFFELNKADIFSRAVAFEDQMRSFFGELKKKYPKWIKEIRGKGFFIGVEFNFMDNPQIPTLLYTLAVNGHASYLLTSYLLNRHHIRVGVTLSSPETIRIEPPAFVTPESIQKLKIAFEDLLQNLETNSLGQLFSHIFSKDEIIPNRPPTIQKYVEKLEGIRDVAFIGHIINWDHAQRLDPSLRGVKPERLKKFFTSYAEFSRPFLYHQQLIESSDGQKIRLNLYGLTAVSDFFEKDMRRPMPIMVETLQEFVNELKESGVEYLGLGQFTSIVTRNGTLLDSKGLSITTGNSLTAAFSIEALELEVVKRGFKWNDVKIGVVGFAGNIGRAITQVLVKKGANVTLVYREAFEVSKRFQDAVAELVTATGVDKTQLSMTSDFTDLKNCDMVVLATNSVQELLQVEHLKPGAVIVDISVPSNVSRAVRSSKEFNYIPAGLARLPGKQTIDHTWVPLLNGDCFACMAETLVLGLSGYKGSFSLGDVTVENVDDIRVLAKQRGFTVTRV